jgi:hypothetical protein
VKAPALELNPEAEEQRLQSPLTAGRKYDSTQRSVRMGQASKIFGSFFCVRANVHQRDALKQFADFC